MDASLANSSAAAPRPGIAERLWEAAKLEFSQRGYHGARVQGIARRAGCNVALLYRHWASKKALYIDILRTTWKAEGAEVTRLLESGTGGARAVVSAYLDALLRDTVASQILVREFLDGGPFLTQLIEAEPGLSDSMRNAATLLVAAGNGDGPGLRAGLDPMMVVLTIAGVAALLASVHEVTRLFVDRPLEPEAWRAHLHDLLVNGLVGGPPTR
jgi:TetR/AcrR family transcriptional regulator